MKMGMIHPYPLGAHNLGEERDRKPANYSRSAFRGISEGGGGRHDSLWLGEDGGKVKHVKKALKEIWTKNFRMHVNLPERERSVDESGWEFQLEGTMGTEV